MPGRNSLAVDTVPVEIQLNTTSKADMLTNMEGMKEGMRSLLKEDKRLLFSSRAKDKMSGGNLSVKDIFPVKKRKRLRITPIPGASLQQKLEWCRRRSSTGSSDATDLEWSDDIDAELTDTGFESSDDNDVELTDSNDSHFERSSTTSPETICGRILAIENVLQVYPAYTFENVDDVVFVVIVEIESDELIPCINDLEINYVVKNISLSSYGKNSLVIKSKIRGKNTRIRNEITYNGNMQRSEKQREEDVSVLVETQLSKKGNEELTKTTICTSGEIPIQKDHNERLGQTVISSEMQLSEEQKTRLSSCIQKNASVLMVNHKWLCIIEGCSYQVDINKTMYEPGLLLYVPVKGFIPIGEEPFKKSYDDLRVFVREGVFRFFTGHADEYHENVRMGCQIQGTALGTLGVFIEHPSYGLCGLTCAHVVIDDNIICNQEIDGHRYFVSNELKVWQPKPPDSIGCVKEVIIKEGSHSQAGMEIVLIRMEQRFPVNGNFPTPKIGAIDISFTSGKTAGQNVTDVHCFKVGSATDYTEGKIIRGSNCVRDIWSSDCLSIPLFNLFKIVPCGTVFADRGDSGAPVFVKDVTGEPVCIGIIEGGNSVNEVYVTHIQDILKECGNSRLKSFDDIIIINQKLSQVAQDVKELYKAHEQTENKIDELGQKMDFYFGQLLANRGSSNQ